MSSEAEPQRASPKRQSVRKRAHGEESNGDAAPTMPSASTQTSAAAPTEPAGASAPDPNPVVRAMKDLGDAVEAVLRVARDGIAPMRELVRGGGWIERPEADAKRVLVQKADELRGLLDVESEIPESVREALGQLVHELERWRPARLVARGAPSGPSPEAHSRETRIHWCIAQVNLVGALAGVPDLSAFTRSEGYAAGGWPYASAPAALADLANQLASVTQDGRDGLLGDMARVLEIEQRFGGQKGVERLRVDVARACAADDGLRTDPRLFTDEGKLRDDSRRALTLLLQGDDPRSAWTSPSCGRAKEVASAFAEHKLAERNDGRLSMLSHAEPIVRQLMAEPDDQ